MKNIKKIIILAFLTISLASCTEQIEIELDSTYTRLVVEGHITTDTTTHWVRLTRSKDYYSSNSVAAASNANVTLDDGFETITLHENKQLPGYYETPENYYGVPGRIYSLDINLEEEVGKIKDYSANCELRPVAEIDSIQVIYNEDWEAYEIKIYTWEPPTTDFYTFQVLKNGVMMTDTIDEFFISDDRFYNGNYTNGIVVGFLDANNPEEKLESGDKVTLKMSGITEEYYNFIYELQDVTFEYRNPLFSGPPANVSTNIPDASGLFPHIPQAIHQRYISDSCLEYGLFI